MAPKTGQIVRQKTLGILKQVKLVDKDDRRPKTSQIGREKWSGS